MEKPTHSTNTTTMTTTTTSTTTTTISFNSVGDKVYVRDEDYAWLPAIVVDLDPEQDRVKVQIDLPNNWEFSTVLLDDDKTERASKFQDDEEEAVSSLSACHNVCVGLPDACDALSLPILPHWGSTDAAAGAAHPQRWVQLDDYFNHQLPLRRQQDERRLVRDLADLEHLHEPAVLYQLKSRHANKKPYTRVGEIVVAVNPCQWIPQLYSSETQRAYALNLIWQGKSIGVCCAFLVESKDFGDNSAHLQYLILLAVSTEKDETAPSSSEEKKDDNPLTASSPAGDNLGVEPHVYEVSALAYRGLALDAQNQTILVSGESGAGKTETVKIALQHLARLPQWRPDCDGYDGGDVSSRLVEKIIKSVPILEAFGNAKTGGNPNSSRVCTVTRLHYSVDTNNHVCLLQGTTTDTCLLETSRLVSQALNERNFHIFYRMLAAPNDVKLELLGNEWESANSNHFRYLHTGENLGSPLPSEEDTKLWETTVSALGHFGWQGESLKTLMQALGAILRLGNITFEDTDAGEASLTSEEDLDLLAQTIGLSPQDLVLGMTCRMITTGHENIKVSLSAEQAKDACDVLAKSVYARIFLSIVTQINQQTAVSGHENDYSTVSLVDLFGFESLETNQLEQLCVNYASEKLQHKYVHDNFKRTKSEYEEEGIDVVDYKAIDNSETIELFEGTLGLIASLDEERLLPNGSNEVSL